MQQIIRNVLNSGEFSVVEQFEISGREAQREAIPCFLFDSRVGLQIQHDLAQTAHKETPLWSHQARALQALADDNNVVISTGTASGKSLVFQATAFRNALLNPDARALVFYPVKALAADQFRSWQAFAQSMALDEDFVGRIDGSVSLKQRENILRKSRIVVMTPDVCHAWLMSRLAMPVVGDFVRACTMLVLDEAHTLEGVFGSNFAFLFRRFVAARNYLMRDSVSRTQLQVIAATATIENPGEHLKMLTGLDFFVVDHKMDGAPQHERLVAHVACGEDDAMQTAKALQQHILQHHNGCFITFLDSRKGVERLAMTNGDGADLHEADEMLLDKEVLPYRAGYTADDRAQIERALRAGKLRGIVATSAMELGIDIPHLQVGITVGVPWTRKSYRQRLGRIGRSGVGVFVVVAPQRAFSDYGTSFSEYHEMSVESSYLYLDNRFMQFAHARCLVAELESIKAPPKTPARIWPKGFARVYEAARIGGDRPREFDAIAEAGSDNPHHNYPLRNVVEVNFKLMQKGFDRPLGDISLMDALRECYPGATYLHKARAYYVREWRRGGPGMYSQPSIILESPKTRRTTTPNITTWINARITRSNILNHNYREGSSGFLVECEMEITDGVKGFSVEDGTRYLYSDLQAKDPNMKARYRSLRTSGIVLCIDTDWFKGVKEAFADKLRDVFVREYSIAPQDVGAAATNIAVRGGCGRKTIRGVRSDCIVIYDKIHGSLRLTEKLYVEFDRVIERMVAATAHEHALHDAVEKCREAVANFAAAGTGFSQTGSVKAYVGGTPDGPVLAYTPGSMVLYSENGGMATEVMVIRPKVEMGKFGYEVPLAGKHEMDIGWVSAEFIEPSPDANAGTLASWNRETKEYERPVEDGDAND